jgi:uncharacterized membrane protein
MSFPFNQVDFKRNAVEPVECIKTGWNLIKSQYWLFVGMTVVGVIIGSVVPLGILMGPMMCGIYLAIFRTRRGQPIEFGLLFKGFDYFGDAVIATLLHMIPIFVVIIPTYLMFYVGMFAMMAGTSRNGEPNPGAMLGFLGIFGVVWLVIMVLLIVLSVVFTFAYPLIVDRRLSGLNAVKLSIRAAFANFWRLLGMLLLTGLMSIGGLILCYVGIFLVMPISLAAIATAYEQVFGLSDLQPNLPPPPPSFHED